MNNKKCRLMASMLICIALWVVYIFENEMSRYGIYTLVDYGIHEILSIVPFICVIANIVFISNIVRDMIKNKRIYSNIVVTILLSITLLLQVQFFIEKFNTITIIAITQVISVDADKEEITISSGNKDIVLTCPMPILKLLEVDGEYLITYETTNESSNKGNVNQIQIIKD